MNVNTYVARVLILAIHAECTVTGEWKLVEKTESVESLKNDPESESQICHTETGNHASAAKLERTREVGWDVV